ncbi:cdc2-related kinase 10 [Trypanosoma brucei equiperdum]|uniref:Cdc2-related kinase 10 n=1 Tax=Trypanosoma brucei equiperdum TaxID=630700 RepID=A0A3L6LC45_9TRYP|nr:cdc2-related kinase 10 [Trypanosoma brucei equiperdum]
MTDADRSVAGGKLRRVHDYTFHTGTDFLGSGMYGDVFKATRSTQANKDREVKPNGNDSTRHEKEEEDGGGDVVALKRTRCGDDKEGLPASALREVMVLKEISRSLEDPPGDDEVALVGGSNLVKLYDVVVDRNCVYIITEFCDGGDLASYLKRQPGRHFTDPKIYRQMMRDLLRGVCYLHRKEISHRDLKPQNILLKSVRKGSRQQGNEGPSSDGKEETPTPSYILKVTDFGLSRMDGIPVKKYQHEAITLWYRSPDVILGNINYRFTADMWSVACIIAEAASGSTLFRGRSEVEQLMCIFSRLGPPTSSTFPSMNLYAHYGKHAPALSSFLEDLQKKYSRVQCGNTSDLARINLTRYFIRHKALDIIGENGVDLLVRLLAYEPQHRLTAEEALQHPFFTFIPSHVPHANSIDAEGTTEEAEKDTKDS